MRTAAIQTVVALFAFVVAASARENGRPASLDTLLQEALTNNPGIQAAENRWRAARQRPAQVSALPDPLFSYTRFGQSVETRVGPQENVFALSQRIPFPGKLGLKGKMAQQDATTDEQAFNAARRDLAFNVKATYYDLYWIDQSIKIIDRYLTLLGDFTAVAEQKYATGQGIQANVLKSQVEISSMMERRLNFDKMRQGVVARMNALLDRPQDTALGQATEMDTNQIQLNEQALIAQALSEREELLGLQATIRRSEYMKRLANKEYLPDFNIQANYIDVAKGTSMAPDAGKDAWSVMVGLNLPIWLGKRKAAVREADEMTASDKLRYENLVNQVKAEVRDVYYQLEISGKTLDLYEQGLLTQAETSLQSTLASYQTGKLDFLNLLDAERMLLNLNLGYVKEQANYHKQVAALERAVGGVLPNEAR